MFDKLVESDLNGADLKPRRRIFVASFLFVGVLFATAVVVGIYAADYTLGTDNFDIAEMLTPVAATEPVEEPEPVRSQQRDRQTATGDQTTRQTNMARIDEPTVAPTSVSVQKNQYLSRPVGKFLLTQGPEMNGAPSDDSGPSRPGGSGSGGDVTISNDSDDEATKTPPPAVPKAEKKSTVKTGGVVNGSATDLPKPVYSAAAQAVRAAGAVNVQVMIDEAGKVISAKAVSGHLLLRREAESAAWKARFKPTTLTGVPVKVSGIIVYNFTR
jgi:TonB family protein